jgi:outer membrane cobalamin receptor
MRRAAGMPISLIGWGVAATLAAARAAPAQSRQCVSSRPDSATLSTTWAPPLDRLVSARATELSLRDAVDRVAAIANLRVSYSAELLPLDRGVCLSAVAVAAGRVLTELLAGTNVRPVALGGDQVVLAPHRASADQPAPAMSTSLGVLDRVVVTGSAGGNSSPEREITVGLNVIDGRQLERDNVSSISDALDARVPGVWGWAQSPSSMVSSFGSIRGASSFGLSYPKMYIDGIEVANPLLLSRINAGSIDHIEVIRGPQGSAMYGSDAISGVVNIVTRHEGTPSDGGIASVRSTAGLSQTSFGHDVLAQDHAFALTTGSSTRSADLHVSAGSIGSFVPDGYSRDFMATGSARIVGATSSLSATARIFAERAGTPDSPLVVLPARGPGDSASALHPADTPQSVSEYTIGATGTSALNENWTMSLVAGLDGYRLDNVQTSSTPIPSVLDSALRAAQGGADRTTLRASSVYRLNDAEATRASFTFALENSTLRLSTLQPRDPGATPLQGNVATVRVVDWQSSTGLVGQTNVALDNVLYATGGVRLEHDSRLSGADQIETLPMLGLAGVIESGPFTIKLRSSYGKGLRPPTTPSRVQLWQLANPSATQAALGPERQSGVESGIDIFLHNALSLQVTRFDQTASGLIQQVGIPADTNQHSRRMIYVAQNVGEITNRGWELQSTGNVSQLAVTGTLSFVDSRVRKLATGYTGDLITGDRMLQVPAITEGFTFAWNASRWRASLGGARALDWVNYDEIKLTQAVSSELRSSHELSGERLRNYWKTYDGALRLRAGVSRDVRDELAIELSVDNLLNHQTGEPDNITIIPGRTIMTGVRLKF